MRDEGSAAGAESRPIDARPMRGQVGRIRFGFWNFTRLGLVLALAVLLSCLSIGRRPPETSPARRLPGAARVPIAGLAFAPDGRSLATIDQSGSVAIRRADEGWITAHLLEVGGRAEAFAFSPDGRALAIGGDGLEIVLWDPARMTRGPAPGIPLRWTRRLCYSPDGRTLAALGDGSREIILWDLDSGRERMTLRGHTSAVVDLAFAPDGRSLASTAGSGEDRTVRIWDLATGRLTGRIVGGATSPRVIAYSSDGRLLAGACPHENPVRIWDVRTGGEILVIAGHSLPTRSVAFSPDGRLLATASGDGTGGVWDVATSRELLRLDGQADVLGPVAFSPDGRTLAATGNDGDVRFWDLGDLIGDRPDRR